MASWRELPTTEGEIYSDSAAAFSPDGSRLAVCTGNNIVKLWDTASGRELITLKGHSGEVRSVSFSPDGKTLAIATSDGVVKLVQAAGDDEVGARR